LGYGLAMVVPSSRSEVESVSEDSDKALDWGCGSDFLRESVASP